MSVDVNDRKQAMNFWSEAREWQSEVNTHTIDLMFFQRILDIYGLKAAETAEARDIEELKKTLSSFLEHRTEAQKRRLRQHEQYLQNIAEDRVLLRDRDMPFKHKDVALEMQEFRIGFQTLKKTLFEKVEHLKNF